MSGEQAAMYELVQRLIDFLWTNPVIAWVAVPLLLMRTIMRFLRWSHSLTHGESAADLQDEIESDSRSFRLQRQGFSRPQQARYGRQRTGTRFRIR